ncbi:aerolysin family beta-barrel pore-forming toxin [Shewanella sp. VB17]|uniref:aerolysin family beta-barrel pore-forming toxin n=1 Tax=Shewanella sp. VB17 TaxID=2739432 RepID=UPI0015635BB3|nr:aerolysin family beta-barrel pore-forming toxin [Shewanella sp. VB17]NRD74397.1 aerolysin family beta-barrel pore-forming toxin [Shewanella sp. VB17]
MRNKILILTLLFITAYIPSGYTIEPIYPDKLKFFSLDDEACEVGYRVLTRDEAQPVKSQIVKNMDRWQISGLANHWVIMGQGYGGEIKPGGASNTLCYPTNNHANEIAILPTNFISASDEVDIQWQLVHDKTYFIKPNSYLAHYLGYAWLAGNDSDYIGDDMNIIKEENGWLIQGNNQGDCDGERCQDKSSIFVSHFDYRLDENSFSYGDVNAVDKEWVKTISANAINDKDRPQQVIVNLRYDISTHWSKTNMNSLSEKVMVHDKFSWPNVGKTELSISIEADQPWTAQNSGVETHESNIEARIMVPAHSSIPIKVALYRSSISYSYLFNADVSYDLTFNGFLRWGGNAWPSHPKNRPTRTHTFTVGRWKDKTSSIHYQWDKRYIQGEVNWWDWSWTIDKYGLSRMTDILSQVLRPVSTSISGDFFAESQFIGDIEIGRSLSHVPKIKREKRALKERMKDASVQLTDINFTADELALLGFNDVQLTMHAANE